MAVNNGLISYPVGVGEVCKVLRTNHADVGWVCSRGTLINKWAKYKPVIYPNLINTYPQLNSNKTWNDSYSPMPWWRASDGKCGMSITKRTTGTDLVDNWNSEWAYNPPTGGMAAPYRLIDFNYYNHAASKLVSITAPSEYYTNSADGLKVSFQFFGSDNGLKLTDFLAINNKGVFSTPANQKFYCGVLVAWGQSLYSTCYKVWATNPNAIGESMTSSDAGSGEWFRVVTVPKSQMPSQSTNYVTVYPYFCINDSYNSTGRNLSTSDAEWEVGVAALPVTPLELRAVVSSISGQFVANSIVCQAYNINRFDVSFNYTVTGYGEFRADVDPYIVLLDADPDVDLIYPDESKIQRYHILNYGEENVNNPRNGNAYPISLTNASENYDQRSVLGWTGTGAVEIGVDTKTYIDNYKAKHGTTYAKIRVCVVLAQTGIVDNWRYYYYDQTVSDEITITT